MTRPALLLLALTGCTARAPYVVVPCQRPMPDSAQILVEAAHMLPKSARYTWPVDVLLGRAAVIQAADCDEHQREGE